MVIPTYNRADDLLKAIESVLNQSYSDWELLIVDNHSTDYTREKIQGINDKRIRLFDIHNDGVIAASRNLGIHQANGKYVAFLDSDDTWEKDKLEKAVFWLKQGYDVVYHDMRIISDKLFYFGPHKFKTRQLEEPVYNDLLVNGNTLPTSSVVVKKDVLLKAGGFKENIELIAGEDYDLWVRLSEVTEQFKRIDGVLGSLSKGNDNQFSSNRLLSVLSEVEKKYITRLLQNEQSQARSNWLNYAYGRSLYNQQKYEIAKKYLVEVLITSANLSWRIKALYMLISIAARKVTSPSS